MKSIKLSLVAALLSVGATTASADFLSDIETSANVSLTSNYIWRGMSQTDDTPAIQGGFDLGYKGIYIGVWGSNVDFDGDDSQDEDNNWIDGDSDASVELDFYAGYASELMGVSYDVGYVQYTYPSDTDNSNFGEFYTKLGYDFKILSVSGMYYVGIDTNDANDIGDDWKPQNGYELGVSVPLPFEVSLDTSFGQYNHTGNYYSAGLSKSLGRFDWTVAYHGMDYDDSSSDNEDNVIVSVGTSF